MPLLDKTAPQEAKTYALAKNLSRLDYLENYLKGREFLLDHFSVADAYLVTIINWTMATPPIELAKWPNVKAYHERLRARPSIAKASRKSSKCTRPNSRATRRRRNACSPDGAQRNPEIIDQTCRVVRDCASLHPGYGSDSGAQQPRRQIVQRPAENSGSLRARASTSAP